MNFGIYHKDTLGIVLAHGKARDQVLRHLPFWHLNCAECVFFTPTDDPLGFRYGLEYSVGRSKNYSADTNVRCRSALEFAERSRYEYVMLIEWDSVIFSALTPKEYPEAGVVGPMFTDVPSEKFKSPIFFHFPQIYRRRNLRELLHEMHGLAAFAEAGFTDRYVGRAIHEARWAVNGKIRNLFVEQPNLVYTKNHVTEADLPIALEYYKRGARWTHGIKDPVVLRALAQASGLAELLEPEKNSS